MRGAIEPLESYAQLPDEGVDLDGVAAAVLNGGMATRFGGVVKGLVEAVDGVSFLEWKLRDAEAAGVPTALMNSFATDEATREFLGERDSVITFTQSVSLRLNPDGSLFPGPSPYAPGHGDFVERAPLDELRDRGVRTVMLSNVDNLGARVDPRVVAAHRAGGNPLTVEVAPSHGVPGGAPVRVDGRSMVVEGLRFPPGYDASRKCHLVETLAPLARLTALESLTMRGVLPDDRRLDPLHSLKTLRELAITHVYEFGLEDYAALARALPAARGHCLQPSFAASWAGTCKRCGVARVGVCSIRFRTFLVTRTATGCTHCECHSGAL